ncbi:MAG: GNAT family N-acetyltransferase [candidate division Zixibacteria bacterium]|nr:GNAT family N-acetyltransferase [candidate division Zixibacteria bacterium]
MKITTKRLTLIAASVELLSAEMDDRADFRQKLGAEVPATWPPDLYDRPAIEFMVNYLKENSEAVGWGTWYLVLCKAGEKPDTLIGTSGYKGRPLADGTVEIGYSVLPEHQRKGYASEAAKALVERAFSHGEVTRVIAETYPELVPSIRVLEKNGFVLTGNGSEPGVIRFELTRTAYERRLQEMQQGIT